MYFYIKFCMSISCKNDVMLSIVNVTKLIDVIDDIVKIKLATK